MPGWGVPVQESEQASIGERERERTAAMRSLRSRPATKASCSLRCSDYIVKARAKFAGACGDAGEVKEALKMLDKANHLLDTLSDDVKIAFRRKDDLVPLLLLLTNVPGVTSKEAFHLSIAFVKQGLTSGRQIVKVRHNSTLMRAIAESAGFGDFTHHRLHEIVRAIVKSGIVKQPRPHSRQRAGESPPQETRDLENRHPENRDLENREVQKKKKTVQKKKKLSFRDFETETEPRPLDVVTKDGKVCRLIN
jgi:hypothetical protein